ncbi:HAD-superfamily hydrolase [Brucella pinnipedialis M163/99/10]|nr:HAD-superfamily hydrolase [Brucella pinnipedialis M163/99/10]
MRRLGRCTQRRNVLCAGHRRLAARSRQGCDNHSRDQFSTPASGRCRADVASGCARRCLDRVVTSGDVTRDLIAEGPRRIFHIGCERELAIYDGLDVELVEEFEAAGVVCTGLYDDEVETPEDYRELLQRLRSRNLPFICANPDIMVERGPRLIWCAGALAREYGQLGGRTLIAGKPHRPIYEAALRAVESIRGGSVDKSRILGIGDGVLTDVKGAADFGLDVLYISGGVHAADYAVNGDLDMAKMEAFLEKHGHRPIASLHALV